MTLEDVQDLYSYWRRVPPLAETMYIFAGGDPKKMGPEEPVTPASAPSESELRAMANLLNGMR